MTNINKPLNFRSQGTLKTTIRHHGLFKNNKQVKNSIVGAPARPATNGPDSFNQTAIDYVGSEGKACVRRPFPMKHWRKQLSGTKNSQEKGNTTNGRSKLSLFDINRPGGSTIISDKDRDCSCEDNNQSSTIRTDFKALNQNTPSSIIQHPEMVKVLNNGFVQVGNPENEYTDPKNNYRIPTGVYNTRYIGCCPENNVIKTGTTNLSKAYFTTTKQYLQSRCKTFKQRQTPIKNDKTTFSGQNANNEYSMGTCPIGAPSGDCIATTIYDPNNKQFARQGAVSSSTRLLQLQVNTITQNGASFYSAWGQEGANAGRYHGSFSSPYFLKSKYNSVNNRCYSNRGSRNLSSCAVDMIQYDKKN